MQHLHVEPLLDLRALRRQLGDASLREHAGRDLDREELQLVLEGVDELLEVGPLEAQLVDLFDLGLQLLLEELDLLPHVLPRLDDVQRLVNSLRLVYLVDVRYQFLGIFFSHVDFFA